MYLRYAASRYRYCQVSVLLSTVYTHVKILYTVYGPARASLNLAPPAGTSLFASGPRADVLGRVP